MPYYFNYFSFFPFSHFFIIFHTFLFPHFLWSSLYHSLAIYLIYLSHKFYSSLPLSLYSFFWFLTFIYTWLHINAIIFLLFNRVTFIRKREALCPHEYTCRIDYAHRRNMGHALFICFPRVLGGLVTNPCARKLFPLITSTRSFMPIVRTNVCGTHVLLHTYSAHRLYTSFIRDVYGNIYPTRFSCITCQYYFSFFKCFICLCEFECKYSFILTFLFSFVYLHDYSNYYKINIYIKIKIIYIKTIIYIKMILL